MNFVSQELDHQRVEFENNKQQLEDAQEKADPSVTARKHWYRERERERERKRERERA